MTSKNYMAVGEPDRARLAPGVTRGVRRVPHQSAISRYWPLGLDLGRRAEDDPEAVPKMRAGGPLAGAGRFLAQQIMYRRNRKSNMHFPETFLPATGPAGNEDGRTGDLLIQEPWRMNWPSGSSISSNARRGCILLLADVGCH